MHTLNVSFNKFVIDLLDVTLIIVELPLHLLHHFIALTLQILKTVFQVTPLLVYIPLMLLFSLCTFLRDLLQCYDCRKEVGKIAAG